MTTFVYTTLVLHWVNVTYEINSEWHLYYCIFLFKHLTPISPKLTKVPAYIGIMEELNCYIFLLIYMSNLLVSLCTCTT